VRCRQDRLAEFLVAGGRQDNEDAQRLSPGGALDTAMLVGRKLKARAACSAAVPERGAQAYRRVDCGGSRSLSIHGSSCPLAVDLVLWVHLFLQSPGGRPGEELRAHQSSDCVASAAASRGRCRDGLEEWSAQGGLRGRPAQPAGAAISCAADGRRPRMARLSQARPRRRARQVRAGTPRHRRPRRAPSPVMSRRRRPGCGSGSGRTGRRRRPLSRRRPPAGRAGAYRPGRGRPGQPGAGIGRSPAISMAHAGPVSAARRRHQAGVRIRNAIFSAG
jgi:hypothetical protein